MKNINYVINGVLAVAIIILFVLQFTGKNNLTSSSRTVANLSDEILVTIPVAYINVDSLLDNYHFSIDLTEQITRKGENAQAYYVQQLRQFQNEVESFDFRYRNNAFTNQERVDQEQRRLEQKQTELQALQERLSMELMEEDRLLNMQLRDTVMTHLREYNQMKGYQIIYGNSSSNIVSPILLADDIYNITKEVTDFLNRKYIGQ